MGDRVAGKVALVTGAARGQGRADALRLAQEGADLIVVDVCAPLPSVAYDSATPEDLAETVRQIQKTGRRVISGVADRYGDIHAASSSSRGWVSAQLLVTLIVVGLGIATPVTRIFPAPKADDGSTDKPQAQANGRTTPSG